MPKNPADINVHHILKVGLIWNGFWHLEKVLLYMKYLKPLVLAWIFGALWNTLMLRCCFKSLSIEMDKCSWGPLQNGQTELLWASEMGRPTDIWRVTLFGYNFFVVPITIQKINWVTCGYVLTWLISGWLCVFLYLYSPSVLAGFASSAFSSCLKKMPSGSVSWAFTSHSNAYCM